MDFSEISCLVFLLKFVSMLILVKIGQNNGHFTSRFLYVYYLLIVMDCVLCDIEAEVKEQVND